MEEQQVQQQEQQPQGGATTGEQQQAQQQEKMLTFTQAQMNALMSREKHEGKDSVYRSLGIDPKDKQAIEGLKNRLAQPPQHQQAQPVSDKQEQAKQEQPVKQPQQQSNPVLNAEAKVALLGAGVQPELLDDALTLLLHKVEKSEQVQTEVDALKAKHAVLFQQPKQTTGQLIGGLGAGTTQQSTAADFGKQLAQMKNANRKQQTFFGGK